jgi:hypothetical protein
MGAEAMRARLAVAVIGSLGLLLCVGREARAQSLYGPGGLFLHPTASLPPKGALTPAVLVLPQHNPLTGVTRTWVSGSLDYGATDDLEVGVTVLQITGLEAGPSEGGFAKYRFVRESHTRPAVAAGLTVLGFGDADSRIYFMALRKQIAGGKGQSVGPHAVVLNAGVQYTAIRDGIPREDLKPYGGMEIGLARRLTFIGEARPQGTAEFATPFALTLAYQYGRAGRLALTWANLGRSESPRFGIGAGIGIGAR